MRQYNKNNNQTLWVIVGGMSASSGYQKPQNIIYYCVSCDINNENVTNLWQQSKITLDIPLLNCKCIITHQSTDNPKLIVLGGDDNNDYETSIHREYDIRQIMGDDHKFNTFMGTGLKYDSIFNNRYFPQTLLFFSFFKKSWLLLLFLHFCVFVFYGLCFYLNKA